MCALAEMVKGVCVCMTDRVKVNVLVRALTERVRGCACALAERVKGCVFALPERVKWCVCIEGKG